MIYGAPPGIHDIDQLVNSCGENLPIIEAAIVIWVLTLVVVLPR
jgi:hypothetical protein